MGDLSRRGDKVPVEARRRAIAGKSAGGGDPIVIHVPAGQPVPTIAPPQPGVTQNIVYVVAPSAPAAAPVTPPPQEVHYHTTTNNNYQPLNRRREKGTSFFGTLSIVVGLLACAAAYVPQPQVAAFAKQIAQAGLALGGVGLLLAILFRRVGRGVPALGILISVIAFPIWLSKTGQLQNQYDQLRTKSPVPLPAIDFSGAAGGAVTVPNPDRPGPAAPADKAQALPEVKPQPSVPHRSNDHSIFGDGEGSWQKPDDVKVPATRNGTPHGAKVPSGAAPGASQPQSGTGSNSAVSPDLSTALANLETARIAAAQRLGLDYTGAKSTAAAATADYQQAQIKYSLQSPALIDAAQKKMTATSALTVMENQLASDPGVAAAQTALKAAKR